MTTQLREGSWRKKPVELSSVVEADEVYILWPVTKGILTRFSNKGAMARRRLKGARRRGTLSTEKPPILGLMQRRGEVGIQMLDNVQQKTIQPIIARLVATGSTFYTDEYMSYDHSEA
ncbi:MAG: transposase [Chloroflexota bacterium]